jgi:hypothetical protein
MAGHIIRIVSYRTKNYRSDRGSRHGCRAQVSIRNHLILTSPISPDEQLTRFTSDLEVSRHISHHFPIIQCTYAFRDRGIKLVLKASNGNNPITNRDDHEYPL